MSIYKLEIAKVWNDEYFWVLLGPSGKAIGHSKRYMSKSGAVKAAKALSAATGIEIVD